MKIRVGSTLLGRYELLRELGHGSAGVVYLVRDKSHPESQVAAKVVAADDHEGCARLRAEFKLLARLHHPNLVAAHELLSVPGLPHHVLTLEHLAGPPLLQGIAGLERSKILRILAEVCDGLSYIHRQSIAHRDIKSENILVVETSGAIRPVITDFGLAGSTESAFGMDPAGTPGYLAPEILDGRAGDHRSDLFSFGVLAFRALSGRSPAGATEARQPLRQLAPWVSPAVSSMLERLLSRDPDHRPQHASEIAVALRSTLDAAPEVRTDNIPASSHWPLSGRTSELRSVASAIHAFSSWAADPKRARGRAVLLAAEPGLGRTRLLNEWLTVAQLAGVPVVMTSAQPTKTDPFATIRPVIRSLSSWVDSLRPAIPAAEILQPRFATLTRALANSTQDRTDLQPAYAEELPTWIQTEFTQLLNATSAEFPFVVLVDDVHHADRASLICLQHLAGLADKARFVLVLSTLGKGEHGGSDTMESLQAAFAAQDIVNLQPLSIHETEALLCSILGPFSDLHSVALEIDRLAGGRPAFIDLVLNELRRTGILRSHIPAEPFDLSALRGVCVPDSINEWVLNQVLAMDHASRVVLGAIAVVNRPVLPTDLNFLISPFPHTDGRPGDQVERCVTDLRERGLIDFAASANGGAIILTHSLLRNAACRALTADELRILHERSADFLLGLPESTQEQLAAEICDHLAKSANQQRAAKYALLAGQSALANRSLEDAVRYFTLSLDCYPSTAVERLSALEGLALALNASAKYVDAAHILTGLLKTATELRRQDTVARALASLAESKLGLSDYAEAEDLAGRSLRLARQLGDPATQARALQAVGDTYHYQSRLEEAKRTFAELAALREALPNQLERAVAAHNLGWVSNSMRLFDEAASHFQKAEAIYRQLANIPRLANTLSSIGANELDAGRFRSAVRHLEDGLRQAGQSHGRRTQGLCYANLGQARYRLGEFGTAIECLLEAQRILSQFNNPRYVAFVEMTLGWVQADKGDIHQAEHFLALAREKSLSIDDQPGLALALAAQGTIHARLGDSLAARFWFERGLELAKASSDRQAAATCLIGLSIVSLDESNINVASEQANEARLLAFEIGAADTEHLATLVLAKALLYSSRYQGATPLIQSCFERIETQGLAADLPRAFMLRSMLQVREGRPAEAAESIDRARLHAAAHGSVETKWQVRAFQSALESATNNSNLTNVNDNELREVHDCLLTVTDENRRAALVRRVSQRRSRFESWIRAGLSTGSMATQNPAGPPTNLEKEPPPASARQALHPPLTAPVDGGHARPSPALRSVLNLLLDRAVHATRSARGGVLLLAGETGRLVPTVLRDLERESLADATEMSISVMEAALEGRTDVIGSDLLSDPAWTGKLTTRARSIPATLALPLLRGSAHAALADEDRQGLVPHGVLYLDRHAPGEPFGTADRRVARRIAAEMVRVLEAWHSSTDTWHRLRDLDLAADLLDRIVLPEGAEEADQAATNTFGNVTIIGSGPGMRRALELTARLAGSRTPVLIGGETGTGKELVARALHAAGPRSSGPFIALDCGALSESVAESELFGHARGAYSGAERDRPGLLRSAEGGTFFLDEIGNLAPALQLKLLRALETNEVRPVGSDRSIPFQARLVAATNLDLPTAVANGAFRADLFHRLQGGMIQLPPLRDHMEDLEPLARFLVARLAADAGRPQPEIAPGVWSVLHRHDWPGNVRELRLTLEVALAMNQTSVLEVIDLPARLTDTAAPPRAGQFTPPTASATAAAMATAAATASATASATATSAPLPETLEGRMILKALVETRWDKAAAARRIGWSRQKLYRSMTHHQLPLRATDREQDAWRRALVHADRAAQLQPRSP